MAEFKAALVRKGFRRVEIDEMYERAKKRLEHERYDPRGKSRRCHARAVAESFQVLISWT
jgi:hypothetical protein